MSSFVLFAVKDQVVVRRGDLKVPGVVVRRKPEARMYLVATAADGGPQFWFHESQLQSVEDANREKTTPLPR